MNLPRYAIKSLLHHWKLNLTVILGVALSTAILLGAFVIGDTVSHSLKQITLQRLGNTDWLISGGERLFRKALADELAEDDLQTCPMLFTNGMAVLNGGAARVNQVQVWGIAPGFGAFTEDQDLYAITGNEAVINEQLAQILGIEPGEELLVRVNKLTAFPANTPFVSADESTLSFRVKVKAVATAGQSGNFNLQNIQSAPKNIFVPLDFLNRQMQLEGKANLILVHGSGLSKPDLTERISRHWQLEDLSLEIRENSALQYTELTSGRVFIEPAVADRLSESAPTSVPVFSYFVNEIRHGNILTPYSFIAGLPGDELNIADNELILNSWLSDDLNALPGDSLQLNYFEVGPLRQLIEKTVWLRVARIVNLEGSWADVNLMPDIPGLSDAGHCSDWETGVPVDLTKIRQKDEDYWNKFKGTPKAFVSLVTARQLWGNRFGSSTALRIGGLQAAEFEKLALTELKPEQVGFQFTETKAEGLQAAAQGTDFSELFIGLSFFVLVAALLLAYLMFQQYLNFRHEEIGTLHALGFPAVKIRQLFFAEAIFLVIPGCLLGIPLGLAYNRLILDAINSIWHDIVRTSILHIHITPNAIVKATILVALISLVSVWFILKQYARKQVVQMQRAGDEKDKSSKRTFRLGAGLVMIALILMLAAGTGDEIKPMLFFISGFLLLPGLILLLSWRFGKMMSRSTQKLSFNSLVWSLVLSDKRRNVLVVSFLSVGVFLVLATGMNRKDLLSRADEPGSGTGGYQFFAQSSFPVLFDLNSPEGQFEVGLEDLNAEFVQFQAVPGDDASCLNLNRVSRPRLLGFNPLVFDRKKAFSFVTQTGDLDPEHPWRSLNKKLAHGQIPAIADQTVIKWGLGKSVGDTLVYQNESGESLVLKLIGGLANSVFQGNILIGDHYFYDNFPSVSGSGLFLIQADYKEEEALRSAFRNYGMEISTAKDRLLLFYQIENTYLNIFLMLGALGLLIGTIGLGIIIYRGIFEKRAQFALLEATGYSKAKIRKMILYGNLYVVTLALFTGLAAAVLSVFPALVSELYAGLLYWSLGVFALVLLSAWFWVFTANRLSVRGNLYEALRND
ncbi:FtsX-like permease family protein [Gaoshiqia hydrogeniformans]|uniref:FtsX-like permease family protein n=1 Tax=Gaoshiqia hydrogeniformans TaxID=3290090 RepID=UPI003BF7F039